MAEENLRLYQQHIPTYSSPWWWGQMTISFPGHFPHHSLREFYIIPPSSRQAVSAAHLATTVTAQESHAELVDFKKISHKNGHGTK